MSLHHLAQHMQSAGRGEDKVLVHMTPKEVQGLQSLAMSHGGSLTINPETGLPEAGFLSSILPMIAGLALAPLTAGTSLAFLGATPFATALTVGGATGLATGSLKKGLMAGLGAYGGAGLGSSLAGMGAGAAGAIAPTAENAIGSAANLGTGTVGTAGGVNSAIGNMASGAGTAGTAGLPTLGTAATNANILSSPIMSGLTPSAQMTPMVNAAPILDASKFPASAYNQVAQSAQSVAPQGFDAIKAGAGQAFDNPMAFAKANMSNLAMAGAPILQAAMEPGKLNAPKTDQGMIRPYTMDRTQNQQAYANAPVYGSPFDSSERQYFTDKYTAGTPYAAPGPEYKATGGLTALAIGGPVEEMAAQNSVGQNTGYPMANLQSPMYSNPQASRPMATNVISPAGDVNTDPYTGEEKFAVGGLSVNSNKQDTSKKFTYNPQTMQFTDVTPAAPANNTSGGFLGNFINNISANQNSNYSQMHGHDGIANLAARIQAPAVPAAPAAPVVSGGVATPYIQPAAPQYVNYQQQAPQMQQAQQPMQRQDNMQGFYDYMQNQMNGMRGYAGGGMTDGNLGGYSDGGHLLRGPGDGVSDSIPASIGDKQPARLADGEFVVPARIVSELGNGSTEAGARQLYKMMERVQSNRSKSVGKGKVAVDAKSAKYLPA